MKALLDLEYQKIAEAQARAAMGFTPPMEDKKPAPEKNANRIRTAKTRRARRKAAKRNRKRKKWRKSRFKSRTDNQDRYSPHSVSDPATATPVSDHQLSTMSPSQPKKQPVDKQPKAVQDSPSASSSSPTDRSAKNKKRKASSKKKLARARNIDATPTATNLKDAFKFAFPTITQTVGSLKGCLRRSLRPLGISDDQVDIIASRLEKATSLINEARPHVFRMIQLFILEEVTTAFSPQGAPGGTDVDPLDLLMNKTSGQTFIRGLMSLALNGKIADKPCKKADSIRSRELAQRVYARYKTIIPDFSPINTTDIPLGDMQMEFGLATVVCLHTHFRKLPSTVTGKMVKLGWSKDVIPLVDGEVPSEAQRQQDKDALDEPSTTTPLGSDEHATDDDGCYKFEAGFLRTWWGHLLSLPAEKRPVFCPQPKLRDTFVMIQERAVKRILWGGTVKNNPAKNIMETILSFEDASDYVDSDYGRILETLFYGRRRPVGHDNDGGPDLRRTSYAKRTTTMAELAEGDPSRYGYRSLQDYCNRKLAYLRIAANCREEDVPCTQSPPEFPSNTNTKTRYALNNMIRSNGLELQILAYDTKHEPHGGLDPVMRIEKVLPDEDAIARIFQGQIPKCRGWDPGEVVAAALCLIEHEGEWNGEPDPGDPPVTNLMIRRAALYSPTTAARSERVRVKNRKAQVVPGEGIDGGIWARDVDPTGARTEVPSIHNMESRLPPKGQVTVEDFEESVRVKVSMEPLLREFEGSRRMKKAAWEEKKSVRAELDMAVAAILRFCGPEPCVIAIGNGKFRTGINMSSKHETLQSLFAKKARAQGHIVVFVDEYLTSTMCPACTARGETSRMAKPTSRSCVCLTCGRWINRDSVGAHNIALIAEQWLFDQSRPISLLRPSVPTSYK
ncbi:hypothetical protein K457DRAFT_181152 [Linnemannia elongata AG-77]|uniref:Cas12f1-like TNB domain-containing protein n=1 Tax=Linnemannia elongata AG-77 TaxID=1314771 RepID=A0A197KH11_9FUNG|nr:hypothetical protein K457DRAFT_181152 [Linnemannia elongata AG-77]